MIFGDRAPAKDFAYTFAAAAIFGDSRRRRRLAHFDKIAARITAFRWLRSVGANIEFVAADYLSARQPPRIIRRLRRAGRAASCVNC